LNSGEQSVDAALADLDAIELAHMEEMIGQYNAAVIDKRDGKPHVVKRMDRPHIRVIPEWFSRPGRADRLLPPALGQVPAGRA